MDVRDDFSVGGAVQRLAIDLEDFIAYLQIRFIGWRSYKRRTQKDIISQIHYE